MVVWEVIFSAQVAQLVEHILGKDEVTSSILVLGSKNMDRKSRIKLLEEC
jgi:hypothetical protein